MEGLPIEPGTWRAITYEVEQTLLRRTPKWRQRMIDAATLAAFGVALAVATTLYVRPWAAGLAAIAVLAGWVVVMRRLRSQSLRRTRWEVMARHGLPICIGCGYNLTALQSTRCPECGRSIDENA